MTLVRINHYYDNGAGNNVGDVCTEVNPNEDWSESQCRQYVSEQTEGAYVLQNNEYARPSWYMVNGLMPDWSDGGSYDYELCESKGESDATCAEGCDSCHHIASCHKLQRKQQTRWIEVHGTELPNGNGGRKELFVAWLDGLTKPEYQTDQFRTTAWAEALDADDDCRSFELEAQYTVLGRPYLYGLS